MKLYSLVRATRNIISKEGADENSPSTIKKGSLGYIVMKLGNGHYLVEFDYEVYKDPVIGCSKYDIEVIEEPRKK